MLRVESTEKGVRLVADDGAAVEVERENLDAVIASARRASADLVKLRLAVVEAAMAEPLDQLTLHQAVTTLLASVSP